MTRDEFVDLVVAAVEALPHFFRERLQNITIAVEDFPSADEAGRAGSHPASLLGLYQGLPLDRRTVWHQPLLPDKITIFQRNIETFAHSPAEMKSLIQKVVMHEIGHHFGLDEETLQRLQG